MASWPPIGEQSHNKGSDPKKEYISLWIFSKNFLFRLCLDIFQEEGLPNFKLFEELFCYNLENLQERGGLPDFNDEEEHLWEGGWGCWGKGKLGKNKTKTDFFWNRFPNLTDLLAG